MNKFGVNDILLNDFLFHTNTDIEIIDNVKQLDKCTLLITIDNEKYIYDIFAKGTRRIGYDSNNITDEEMMLDFMHRFNSLRKRNGYTILDVSQITTIPTSTLSRYANGETTPSVINLRKIAKALRCKITDLIVMDYE